MSNRTVFYVSDGTGITAETFGTAILNQFEVNVRQVRLPFTDTVDKAHQVVRQINHTAVIEGKKPIVFTTLVNRDIIDVLQAGCKGMLLDTFGTFIAPLEQELGLKSNHRVGRFTDISQSKAYNARIEAINFSLEHDDGQTHKDLDSADVILVGVSRSGKTPTSLYLAMQHGMKAANYPLIPRRLRAPPVAARLGAPSQEDLRPDDRSAATLRDPQRTPARFTLRLAAELPLRSLGGRGHDAARRRALAVDHHQVHRRDRHHDPAGNQARTPGHHQLLRPGGHTGPAQSALHSGLQEGPDMGARNACPLVVQTDMPLGARRQEPGKARSVTAAGTSPHMGRPLKIR